MSQSVQKRGKARETSSVFGVFGLVDMTSFSVRLQTAPVNREKT